MCLFPLGSSDMSPGAYTAALVLSLLSFNTPQPASDRWCLGLGAAWVCTGSGQPGPVVVAPEAVCHCHVGNQSSRVTSIQPQPRPSPPVPSGWTFASLAQGIILLELVSLGGIVSVRCYRYRRRTTTPNHAIAVGPTDSSPLSGRSDLVARARRSLAHSNVTVLDSKSRQGNA